MDGELTKNDIQEIVSESVAVLMYAEEASAAKVEALLKKIEADIANLQTSLNTAMEKIEQLETTTQSTDTSEKAVISTLLT